MLSFVAVIDRARSEAANTATLPTSSSVAPRPSNVWLSMLSMILSPPGMSDGIASTTPPVCRFSTRMPYDPSSAARFRRKYSTAPNATCNPPRL
jgi:hypothetical protein